MTTASTLSRMLHKLRSMAGFGSDEAAGGREHLMRNPSQALVENERPPVLDVRGLTKSFLGPDGRPFKALDRVSLRIDAPGALVALTGPDGAGKTTFIRLLSGLLAPDRGEQNPNTHLLVLSRTPDTSDVVFTGAIGVMPQKFGLYEDLSARENLECFAALKGVPMPVFEKRFADLMTLTGLAGVEGIETRPAGAYSGGMKQKLALACALLSEPPLLLLDEPTVGVDPLSRRELMRIVETMRRRSGTTVVFSTAYLEEAEAADRVVVFANGRILADDRPEILTARAAGRTWAAHPAAGTTLALLSRALMGRAEDPSGVLLDAVPRGGAVALTTRAGVTEAMLRETLARFNLPPHSLVCRPPRLEDAYADLTFDREGEAANGTSRCHGPAEAPCREPTELRSDAVDDCADASFFRDASLPVVEARGLERRFGDFVAVRDTSFAVRRGEIFGLLGPNGAGKTTTFRMLCGLIAATSGEVCIEGVPLDRENARLRARLGYVAQKFSLYERLTARQNLRYFARCFGVSADAAERALEGSRLGGFGERPASEIPPGAKRELAMAAALLHRPSVLFLDEATSGADVAARRSFWRRITELAARGTTVVVTTHFMEEAEYCDRFLIQDAGRVLVLGTPDEVRAAAFGPEGGSGRSIEEAFVAIVTKSREAAK